MKLQLLIAGIYESIDFCILSLYPAILLLLLVSTRSLFCWFFQIFYTIMSSVNKDCLIHSFLTCWCFVSFSCLMSLVNWDFQENIEKYWWERTFLPWSWYLWEIFYFRNIKYNVSYSVLVYLFFNQVEGGSPLFLLCWKHLSRLGIGFCQIFFSIY